MIVKRFNFFLYFFFFGILTIYAFRPLYLDQLHVIRLLFLIISLIFLLSFIHFKSSGSSGYILSLAGVAILLCSSIYGMYLNGPSTTIPTLARYLLVLFVIVFFNQRSRNSLSFSELELLIICLFFFLLVFSFIQVITGNLAYKTSTYRLSSVYGDNVTGFSLLMTIIFLYFYNALNSNFSSKNIFYVALSLSMVLATQSRLAAASCLFLALLYHLLILRISFKSFIITSIGIISILVIAYGLIFYLNFLPRLMQSFEYQFQDASTQNRIIAWITVMESLSNREVFFGIGIGGFHHRYNMITGIEGMDAHFDFIKIYIEHGLILFTFYICSIFAVMLKFLKKVLQTKSKDSSLALVIFLNTFIFSSLHNAFFYFESMVLGCIIIGVITINSRDNLNKIRGQ